MTPPLGTIGDTGDAADEAASLGTVTFCQFPLRVSEINSPSTFCESSFRSQSVRSTHQSHSVSLTLRHDQCDQLTNHILSASPSVTISAINSPITFCHPHPLSRSVRSTHQSHSVSFTLCHDQCDQLTNHILPVSPHVNSPITFCQSHPPSTHRSHSVSLTPPPPPSTHQSHYVSLTPPPRQLTNHILSVSPPPPRQLTNHILSVSPPPPVNSPITLCQSHPPPVNSPITFCQSHPPPVNSPITFCQSHPPPPPSTHQSHSASLTLRHDQCDQLTNHILSVSPSATFSAINSTALHLKRSATMRT